MYREGLTTGIVRHFLPYRLNTYRFCPCGIASVDRWLIPHHNSLPLGLGLRHFKLLTINSAACFGSSAGMDEYVNTQRLVNVPPYSLTSSNSWTCARNFGFAFLSAGWLPNLAGNVSGRIMCGLSICNVVNTMSSRGSHLSHSHRRPSFRLYC